MVEYTVLRPKAVKDYIERHVAAWKEMNTCLRQRDDLQRQLNERHGFRKADGSFDANRWGLGDARYLAEYDVIEKAFKQRYEKPSSLNRAIDKECLSLHEYLLFDNASEEAKQALLDKANASINEIWSDFIRTRAYAEIRRYSNQYTIGGISEMIEHEKRDFGYRATRCRQLFGISLINLSATSAIMGFKSYYTRELNSAFKSLTALGDNRR